MPIYRDNLQQALIPLLQRVQNNLSESKATRLDSPGRVGEVLRAINQGVAGLHMACSYATEPSPVTASTFKGRIDDGWMPLILNELSDFNAQGTDAIQSCSEALLKTHGLINAWHSDPRQRSRIFYRGEVDYSWSLVSRLGRKGIKHNPTSLLCATEEEMKALTSFQERVSTELALRELIFGKGEMPDFEDPCWWELAQHYDFENGTRMLDLTTSIFSALYFACCDWNGGIDTSIDGALYLFPHEPGRSASRNPDIVRGVNVGPTDLEMDTASTYFNIEDRVDTPRFREARGRNDRLIAQDGFLFWQAKFDTPMELNQHFKFRVFREAKPNILRELYSIGYTAKRIVRGTPGADAHLSLCRALDLSSD